MTQPFDCQAVSLVVYRHFATAPLSKAYAISGRYCSGKPPDGFATYTSFEHQRDKCKTVVEKSDRLPQPTQQVALHNT